MEVNIREEAVYSLDIRDIEQTHFDTAHGDTAPHDDVAHDDWDEHADTAHGDAGHGDSTGAHTDSWDHNLVNHTDTYNDYELHSDHGDVPHQDWGDYNDWSNHSDSPHTDIPHEEHADSPHEDTAHTDTPHEDTTHGDYLHTDTAHTDHSDHTDWDDHSDWFHAEAVQGHTDHSLHNNIGWPLHLDWSDHSDWTNYGDHAEYHAWNNHSDYSAYNDASYIDHDDHTDTAHTDVPYNDAHDDAAHGDAPHNDAAHADWGDHSDVAHDDWSNFNIRSTRPPFVTPFAGGLLGYRHRKKGAVNATTAGAQTNYQLKLIVGESSGSPGCDVHCENNCLDFPNDIRFTKEDGETKHDYWIEEITGTTPNRKVTVWVEVAAIPASGSVDFYMYYRKASDSGESNGTNTFEFFDDFPGSSLDAAKWNIQGTIGVSNSEATLNADDAMYSKDSWGYGYAVKTKAKADEQDAVFVSWRGDFNSTPSNGIQIHNSDFVYPDDFDRFDCWASNPDNDYYADNQLDFRNVYRKYEITRINGEAKYYQDGNLMHTRTTSLPTGNLGVGYRVWDSSQASTLIADWALVRKYNSPEPTWGSWGIEQ